MITQIISFANVKNHNGDNIFGAIIKGYDAGKKDGLSAKDTEQVMKNTVEEMGKLSAVLQNGTEEETIKKVDEIIDTDYYKYAVKARATTDMLIGSVSQVALNHIGLLVVDEIQNVVNNRQGKSLVGMLT